MEKPKPNWICKQHLRNVSEKQPAHHLFNFFCSFSRKPDTQK